jgi:hypothetical protein
VSLQKQVALTSKSSMKQRMKAPYEKGVAICSASSRVLGTARHTSKRRQRIGGVGIQPRKLSIRTPTPSLCAEGNMNRRASASSCSGMPMPFTPSRLRARAGGPRE